MDLIKGKINFWFFPLALFFAIVYALISIIPHFTYHTNAFDLGIFNQALNHYSQFLIGPNTVRVVPTLLADHFEGILFFFTPFYYLFGSYTLLILQIVFIILGGLGVYLLVKKEANGNERIALGSTLIFFLFFGIFTALAFDYHNNVIGAMLLPWLFYFLEERKFTFYYLILFLFLITKENMALISAFLGISILIFEPKSIKKHGLITFLVSVIYFVVILKVITYLNGVYDHWSYDTLGAGPSEALKFIFFHPIQTATLLFNDPAKIKMWALFLASGGILAILKPKYSLLLLPVIGQKFFSDKGEALWGHNFHYAVEFAPIVAIGVGVFVARFKKISFQYILLGFLVLMNIFILSQINFSNLENVFRIFKPSYYTISYRDEINEAFKLVKNAESVSAQNSLIPHLKNNTIWFFPAINNADYIFLNLNERSVWPFKNKAELLQKVEEIEADPNYKKIYHQKEVYVFQVVRLKDAQ